MRFISANEIDQALSYPRLVDVMASAFRTGTHAPLRHHHTIQLDGAPDATLLLMPAWTASPTQPAKAGRYMGVKSVTVFPGNGARGKPAVLGVYILMSAETGETLAILDATRLTAWRTAAASALAARHLAREDAQRLVMVGSGALAPFLIRAHASVRPLRHVSIWSRKRAGAETLAAALAATDPIQGLVIEVIDNLETAMQCADIISTATLSTDCLVRGAWLQPGQHLDCVGAFTAKMRETDDEAVARARLYVDTRDGAFGEAGDILQAIASGCIGRDHVLGDLADLVAGRIAGRATPESITMFKSVGTSIEDLAAAIEVYETVVVSGGGTNNDHAR